MAENTEKTPLVGIIMGSKSDLPVMEGCTAELERLGVPHLGGVVAAFTPLPVVGVPMKTSDLGGMDSLLSMVQMPSGVPVACVAINGAKNAAIYATQILGATMPEYREAIVNLKNEMAQA